MDASQYKDYVLVPPFRQIRLRQVLGSEGRHAVEVPKGGSFADMVALQGDKEIGAKINKIIAKL